MNMRQDILGDNFRFTSLCLFLRDQITVPGCLYIIGLICPPFHGDTTKPLFLSQKTLDLKSLKSNEDAYDYNTHGCNRKYG